MEQHKFKFHFIPFITAFFLGLGYVYISNGVKEKVVKKPTPFNQDTVYHNQDGTCFKVHVDKTECNGDEKEFEII